MQRENTPEYPTDLYHFMDIASSVLISSLGTKPFHVDSATHSPSPDGFSMNPISLFNPWTPSIPVSEKLQSTIGMKLASDTHDQDMFHLTSLISSVPMGFLDPKTFPLYTMMQAYVIDHLAFSLISCVIHAHRNCLQTMHLFSSSSLGGRITGAMKVLLKLV